MKSARPPEGKPSAAVHSDSKYSGSFLVTHNAHHLCVIQALMTRPLPREQLDQVAGGSNGRELVAELRRRGLKTPCTRTKHEDRDLFDCWPGVSRFTEGDRRKLKVWERERASKGHA